MHKCPITGKVCLKFKAYQVTNIEKKDIDVISICEDCLSQIDNKNILKNEDKPKEEPKLACKYCKLTFDELIKKSRLGCEKCYYMFEKPLTIALEKLQKLPPNFDKKELKHTGRVPTQWKKKQAAQTNPNDFLNELKLKMQHAIDEEKYELAGEFKNIIIGFDFLIERLDEFKSDQEQYNLIRDQISEFIYLFREKELEE